MATTSAMTADVESVEQKGWLATVVVCTYNRAELLRGAIESLLKLRMPLGGDVEILVVDNASTDQTAEVVGGLQQNSPITLRYVFEPNQGIAHARNRGLEEARGGWVAFFDDDQIADSHWLVGLIDAANRHRTFCVGGAVKLLLPEDYREPLSGVCRVLLSESPANAPVQPYRDPRTPGTGNMLLRRDLARRLGGFDVHATMGGEDTDLYRRMRREGVLAWYEPTAVIYHHVPHQRLSESYMLWNASRTGVHVADTEHQHFGKFKFVVRLMLRCGQASLKGPGVLWRRYFASQASERTGARCILAAAVGYLRRTARWYVPSLFAQDAYFRKLDFRSEREQFGS